jgi:protein involved in polysaccharide export with SLBB domain
VNFVMRGSCLYSKKCVVVVIYSLAILASLLLVSGCSDGVRDLSPQEILEFNQIGPEDVHADMTHVVRASPTIGSYRVVPDDVLELVMPSILRVVASESVRDEYEAEPFTCRIRDDGTISLPVAGDLLVAGRSLAEIERGVVSAYYPKYTQERPAVFARVAEHKTYKVSITGVVGAPGVYELRGDQMSLFALLREAQGIIIRTQMGGASNGASAIRIERVNSSSAGYTPVHFNSATNAGNAVPANSGNRKKSLSLATFMDSQGIQAGQNVDIKLSFRPQEQGSTTGYLSIKRQERTIVRERINLASEAQRLALLSRATSLDPCVSMVYLNNELTSLVSMLYGHSVYDASVQFASTALSESPSMPDLMNVAKDIQKVEQHRNTPTARPKPNEETIILPVTGMNVPYADVALQEGDRVIVEQLHMPLFAVVGLVASPGNYEYPPGADYNLLQAVAFAGGLDPRADPRYVTVYRLKGDGSIARITFKLKDGSRLTDQLNIPLKRGDIVSVEHTPRTRTVRFLNDTFRMTIGTYFRPEEIWD